MRSRLPHYRLGRCGTLVRDMARVAGCPHVHARSRLPSRGDAAPRGLPCTARRVKRCATLCDSSQRPRGAANLPVEEGRQRPRAVAAAAAALLLCRRGVVRLRRPRSRVDGAAALLRAPAGAPPALRVCFCPWRAVAAGPAAGPADGEERMWSDPLSCPAHHPDLKSRQICECASSTCMCQLSSAMIKHQPCDTTTQASSGQRACAALRRRSHRRRS